MGRLAVLGLLVLLGLLSSARDARPVVQVVPVVVLFFEVKVGAGSIIAAAGGLWTVAGVAWGARAAAFAKADDVWMTDPTGVSEEAFWTREFPYAGGYGDPSETATAVATSATGTEVKVEATSFWNGFRYQGEVKIDPFKPGNDQSILLGAGFARGTQEMIIERKPPEDLPGAPASTSAPATPKAVSPTPGTPAEAVIPTPGTPQAPDPQELGHIPLDLTIRMPAMALVLPRGEVARSSEVAVLTRLTEPTANRNGEAGNRQKWEEVVFSATVTLFRSGELEVSGDLDLLYFDKPYVDDFGNTVVELPKPIERTVRVMVPVQQAPEGPLHLELEGQVTATPLL